jgi:hypothetical protein
LKTKLPKIYMQKFGGQLHHEENHKIITTKKHLSKSYMQNWVVEISFYCSYRNLCTYYQLNRSSKSKTLTSWQIWRVVRSKLIAKLLTICKWMDKVEKTCFEKKINSCLYTNKIIILVYYRGCWKELYVNLWQRGLCVPMKKNLLVGQWNCWIWRSKFVFLNYLQWTKSVISFGSRFVKNLKDWWKKWEKGIIIFNVSTIRLCVNLNFFGQ